MLMWIYGLMIAAAVLFLMGAVQRFIRHKEATVWWRGSMGLLAFACTLMLLEIYQSMTAPR